MRKISKEEYLQEIEELKKERDVLELKRNEILHSDDASLELEGGSYLKIRFELKEKNDLIDVLNSFFEHLSYKHFYNTFLIVEDYFKKKYNEEDIELPQFILDRAAILLKKENDLPKLDCSLHPYAYDDPYYFDSRIEKDVNKVKTYFSNKKRDFIYTWEASLLVLTLYYDKMFKTNITSSLFIKSTKKRGHELEELTNNFSYLLNKIQKEGKLNLSLFLWTVYKTYHYFRKNDSDFIIDEQDFVLFEYLLDSCFLFFNRVKFEIVEKPISSDEQGFIRHLCGLLSNDLVLTIINSFPDYYDSNIMFLGYGCHIPAGCSDLYTSMRSFDKFLEGICDYDYWYDEDIKGEDFLLKKLRIKKDYEKLIKVVNR